MALSAEMRAKLRQAGNQDRPSLRPSFPVTEERPAQSAAPAKVPVTQEVPEASAEGPSEPQEGPSGTSREDFPGTASEARDEAMRGTEKASEETTASHPQAGSAVMASAEKPEAEEGPVGIRYRRDVGKQPRPPVVTASDSGTKPLSLRIPPSLVDMCKRSGGDTAVANSNAVAAFLYAFRDKSFDGIIDYSDVPDGVVAFSRTFDIMKERAEFNKRVSDIDRRVKKVADTQESVLWSILYLIWDVAGLRTDHPDDPSEIGFGQDPEGFEAAMAALRKAVSEHQTYLKRKEGRPIK